jgi:HAD superfamily hydrolase (TIGR01509 family)
MTDWTARAVVFDLDGLLIDTEPLFAESVRRLLTRRGLAYDPAFMHRIMGIPAKQSLPMFVAEFKLADTVEELGRECTDLFLAVLKERSAPLMGGARELVTGLAAKGTPRAIATSSTRPFVDQVFGPHGLLDHFAFVLTADDVTHGKPHPEVYERAAARLGLAASEVLVLEDSVNGMRAAKAAGARCVVVPHDHSPHDLLRAEADAVVDSLADARLLKWLGL